MTGRWRRMLGVPVVLGLLVLAAVTFALFLELMSVRHRVPKRHDSDHFDILRARGRPSCLWREVPNGRRWGSSRLAHRERNEGEGNA